MDANSSNPQRMKKHTKIYFNYFGYDTSDIILCEICNAVAVDLHHIEPRSMGGNPKGDKDVIENIMALCRSCHIKYEGNKKDKEMLKVVHLVKMNERGKH